MLVLRRDDAQGNRLGMSAHLNHALNDRSRQ